MSDRRVSIILPTFNGATYLRESIESCLVQTHPHIELIIVDDGSTDETANLLHSYPDPRIVVLRHDHTRGLPEALNTGFARSSGEYLSWTSSDNRYAPTAIEEMADYLDAHPHIALVYTDLWTVDEFGRVVGTVDALPADHMETQPWNGVHACFLYRRLVYERIGDYEPRARLAEDYDYWLRIAERFQIAPHHARLYYYRRHAASLTGTQGRYAAARAIVRIRRRRRWISLREYLYWSAHLDVDEAFWNWQHGNWQRVRQMALRGLAKNPGNLGNVGLLSVLAEATLGTRTARRLRAVYRSAVGRNPSRGDGTRMGGSEDCSLP